MEKECQVNELGGYSQCYVENSCSVCEWEKQYEELIKEEICKKEL